MADRQHLRGKKKSCKETLKVGGQAGEDGIMEAKVDKGAGKKGQRRVYSAAEVT